MDPHADRRAVEDRRNDGVWSTVLKVLGSPVSIIVVLGGLGLSTINIVERANNAMPAPVYYELRAQDSLQQYFVQRTHDAEHKEFQVEIENIRLTQGATNSKIDTLMRIIRRSICRAQPDYCP